MNGDRLDARLDLERTFDRSACERLAASNREYQDTHGHYLPSLASLLKDTRAERDRLLFLAEHMFAMIPQSVWRDSGADDGQGHFEGDYRAEQVRDELAAVREIVDYRNPDDSPLLANPVPLCPHCGAMSVSVLYASTFHEHTCTNLHVWRIY